MQIGPTNHIGGLASGMDIDSQIERLMEARRQPVNSLRQDKQELQWKQEDYREINKKLRSFSDVTFDMKLERSYMATNATSSDESIVTASASSGALEDTHKVNVNQLAEKASVTSDKMGSSDDPDTSTLSTHIGISGDRSLGINGEWFGIDTDNESIHDLVSKINEHNKSNEDFKVSASYDENTDRLYLKSDKTGVDNQIIVKDNYFAQKLSLTSDTEGDIDTSEGSYAGPATVNKGLNAEVEIDNVTYTDYSSNKFTLNDVTYNLHSTSNSDVTVDVSRDTEKIVENITSFIDKYNETIRSINEKLEEPYYNDYPPLTDNQRQELTDDQINKWEERARSGLLRNDPILSNITNKMRSTMSSIVPDTDGEYDRLSDIGIETTSNYRSDQLTVDEDKLRSAVENNPESVKELFRKNPDSEDYNDMGIARRLDQDIENGISRISDKAGSSNDFSLVDNSYLGREIDRIEERIETKEERLQRVEERYWDQFTRMEKYIQEMNQQSQWMQQQFGGGGGMMGM